MKVNNQSTFYQYADRSIQLWLTRGVMRPMSLSARLTASLFIGFLIVGFTVAALLPTVLQVFWTSMPYLALTVLLAVIIRSPFFAVGGTIVYGTAVERLIPVLSAGAAHFEGTCSGAPTRGNGYVELTGYAGNLPLP